MEFAKKHSILLLLITVLAISFLGSLPPGTTNVLTLQIASQSIFNALLFSLGCLLGEMIYVSLCIVMMNRLLKFKGVMKVLEWISFGVIMLLAIISLFAAVNNSAHNEHTTVFVKSPFFSGLGLMIINPVQIPFWLGWTTILYEKNILKHRLPDYLVYVAAAGIGSLLASLLFVVAGDYLSRQLTTTGQVWNYALSVFFLATAAYQLKTILTKRTLKLRPTMPIESHP